MFFYGLFVILTAGANLDSKSGLKLLLYYCSEANIIKCIEVSNVIGKISKLFV